MSHRLFCLAAGALLLAAAPLRADDAEDQAVNVVKAVENARGLVVWENDDHRRPIITEVHLSYALLEDIDLKKLASLKGLRTLDIGGNIFLTDVKLKELAALKGLQTLDLAGTLVTDAGLKELAALKGLQTLDLSSTSVTDAGLKELAPLQGLQTLHLHHMPVKDAWLKELAPLQGLQMLDLRGTKVTDAGLKELAALKGLQEAYLYNSKVTDPSVANLKKALPNLWPRSKRLWVGTCRRKGEVKKITISEETNGQWISYNTDGDSYWIYREQEGEFGDFHWYIQPPPKGEKIFLQSDRFLFGPGRQDESMETRGLTLKEDESEWDYSYTRVATDGIDFTAVYTFKGKWQ